MTFDEIASRLEGLKKTGKNFIAICPSHDDRNPSLSVRSVDGKVLLKCHAGCDTELICRAIGISLTDLFEKSLNGFHNAGNGHSKAPSNSIGPTIAEYIYRDADGIERYRNVRHSGVGRFYRKPSGVDSLPYRLPELLKAKADGIERVFVCEGEKDCDNVRGLGFVAVSLKGIKDTWAEYFTGMHVTIIQDHDKPGTKQAVSIAHILATQAASVRITDLYPSEPMPNKNGKDVSDWIGERRTAGDKDDEIAEELSQQMETSKLFEARPAGRALTVSGLNLLPLDELLALPEEVHEYIWEDILIRGGFSIISGKPKSGKSTLMRCLAASIKDGRSFLGKSTKKGKVLYLCLEERRAEVVDHFRRMDVVGGDLLIHAGSTPENVLAELLEAIEEHQPVFVVIDPMSRVLRARDFNDYAQMSRAFEPIIDMARTTGAHILCLHHDGKSGRSGGDALLGSTAIFGAVDSHIQVKRKEGLRTVSSTQRYGVDLAETVFELDPDTGWISASGTVADVNLSKAQDAVLEVLSDGEELAASVIKDRITGLSNGVIAKALKVLEEAGKVGTMGEGKRGKPRVFFTQNKVNTNNGLVTVREGGYSGYDHIAIPGIPRDYVDPVPCLNCLQQCRPGNSGLCVICEQEEADADLVAEQETGSTVH